MRYPDAGTKTRPIIQQHFFEDAQDRRLARESLKRCHALLQAPSLSAIGRPV
jgi:hypothetical protein